MLSAMLDDTMGPAVLVMTEGRSYTTTISLTVNFLASARPGPITAEARSRSSARRLPSWKGKLTAEDGTLLATATTVARLLDAARGDPLARAGLRQLHDRRLGVERLDLEARDALVVGGDVFQLLAATARR